MKKSVILVLAVSFLGTIFLTSCGHHSCPGATTQVEKVKVSSERPL